MHVAINRMAIQPGNDERLQQAAQALFDARRPLLGSEVHSMQLVRSVDGNEYALITVWWSAEADASHENDAAEQQAMAQIGPIVVGAPSEFTGTVVAKL